MLQDKGQTMQHDKNGAQSGAKATQRSQNEQKLNQKRTKWSQKDAQRSPKGCQKLIKNRQKCVRGVNRDKASIWVAKWASKTRIYKPFFDPKICKNGTKNQRGN